MSSFRSEPGWVAHLISRMENALAQFSKIKDDGGRLRGTPDTVVGVFPSESSQVTYDPTTPTDWDGPPDDTKEALDEIAGRVETLEGGVGSDASAVTYTPADATDWSGGVDPGNADDAFDQLADRLKVQEAVTSGSGTADPAFVYSIVTGLGG